VLVWVLTAEASVPYAGVVYFGVQDKMAYERFGIWTAVITGGI
jgi:hypothetical protein